MVHFFIAYCMALLMRVNIPKSIKLFLYATLSIAYITFAYYLPDGGLGIDYETYVYIFYQSKDVGVNLFYEPIMQILFLPFNSFETFHVLWMIILLSLYFFIVKGARHLAFTMTLAPLLLVNASFNGMRIGLAMMLFAVLQMYGPRQIRPMHFIAPLTHISSTFFLFFLNWKRPRLAHMLLSFPLVILASIFFIANIESIREAIIPVLISKSDTYAVLKSPNILSGLSDLYLIVLALICSVVWQREFNIKLIVLTISGVIVYVFLGDYYFSLRILKIISFLSILIFSSICFSRRRKIIAIGLMAPYSINYILDYVSNEQ